MSRDRAEAVDAVEEVLFALARGGRLSAAELERRTGVVGEELAGLLASLEEEGQVERAMAPDRRARFRLTPMGAGNARTLLCRERDALAADIEAVLPDFDSVNAALKELLHRWQMRPEGTAVVVNDHHDRSYDERILRDLGRLWERAQPSLRPLAELRPRYARYRQRIELAVARAGRGEIEFVAGLAVDSVHSVWWELHADLLAVAGRARGEADA